MLKLTQRARVRRILFMTLLILTLGLLTGSVAARRDPLPPAGGTSQQDDERPPLQNGSPYGLPLIPSQSDDAVSTPAETLTIDVWYGDEQTFGQLGTPQTWLNILGNVSGPREVTSLTYQLNGGPSQFLTIGSNDRRVYREGDFNIELNYQEVLPAPQTNEVVITADDGESVVDKTVIVTYEAGNIWPLPYLADWSSMASVNEGAQVVDGLWDVSDGVLENVYPGFDRLVAIGDLTWTDYEVTVPVTVHSLNTSEWSGPSVGGGVGMILRWPGHTEKDPGEQPRRGWRDLGVLGWYRWTPPGLAGFQLIGQGGQEIASRSDKKILLGVPYIFKMRVESAAVAGQTAMYSFKFWEVGQPEPAGWYMQAPGRPNEPASGSLILLAHQSEVTFGNVTVVPLNFDGLTITVEPAEHGTIELSPAKSSYQLGEQVEITAVPQEGYKFIGWQGDLAGDENPQTVTMTENITVAADFEQEIYRVYISPVASGEIGDLSYVRGDVLGVDSAGSWTKHFSAANSSLGATSDIEAFTFMPDGSLLVAVGRARKVDGLGTVAPSDIVRLRPDENGHYESGTVEWFLDGSDVGLTGSAERIDALTMDANGRIVVSVTGTARVTGLDGSMLVVRDEDFIAFSGGTGSETSVGRWELVCDGSAVPGLARENVVGASLDSVTGTWYLTLLNGFNVNGVRGTARDVISLSDCSADAEVRVIWNASANGMKGAFDALEYVP